MFMPMFSPILGAITATFIGQQLTTTASVTDTLAVLPAGSSAGDTVLIIATMKDVRTVTFPSGTTQLQDVSVCSTRVNWKSGYYTLTSTDITNGYITIAISANGDGQVVALYTFQNAVISVEAAYEETLDDSTPTVPSVTTVVDAFYIAALATERGKVISAYPTTYTNGNEYLQDLGANKQSIGTSRFQEDAATTVSGETFTMQDADESYITVFKIAGI